MTPRPAFKSLLTLSLIAVFSLSFGQNLEEIGIDKGLKLNGSLNLNTIGYFARGIEQRRDPFNFFFTGNLNVNLFGYSAPFSFSYSNANRNFSQPFNQFSFAPQYKWVKTYIGYNSMTFSSYTLAGHVFLGGGAELTPGKWRIAMMAGRLRKAVPFNLSDSLQHTQASYKRMGYGLKVGYENNGDMISANVFTAKDDEHSIPFELPDSQLSPQQNIAAGISFRKRFFQRFFVDAEYAVSALNKDTRSNETDTVLLSNNNLAKGIFPSNPTRRYFDAFNTSIGYQANWYGLRFKYERIAPEYQTLGAYYFNNDMENITVIPSLKLFQGTLNLSGNVGLQRNNLDNAKASSTERGVAAINANYVPGALWNFAASYSNFTSYTNMRPQKDPFFQNSLDTLNFYQVSKTMSGTVMRGLGSKEKPQSIMLNVSYQKASDHATYQQSSNFSDFKSVNLSYSYAMVPKHTTLVIGANVYENTASNMKSRFYGPTLGATKALLEKKLKLSLTTSYNQTNGSNVNVSPVLNNRFSLNYNPAGSQAGASSGRHNFSAGINALRRLKSIERQPAYTEVTITCNYTYSF